MWAAVGICTGNILWPIVTMAGLSALIAAFPWILAVLYLAGGLFLIRMGIGSLRSGWAERQAEQRVSDPSSSDASTATVERTPSRFLQSSSSGSTRTSSIGESTER